MTIRHQPGPTLVQDRTRVYLTEKAKWLGMHFRQPEAAGMVSRNPQVIPVLPWRCRRDGVSASLPITVP